MKLSLSRKLTAALLCISLLLLPKPAHAESLGTAATVAIVAAVAVGVAIGVGVYFLVRRPSSITGCTVSGSNGLTLQNENDLQTYNLTGDIGSIKTGERIKLSGKKKKEPSGKQDFFVEKLSKDFGACKISPATP